MNNKHDWFFIILCGLLFPATFFMIAGSQWEIWSFIPNKWQSFFLNGDQTLYSIGINYIGSFIFYLMINYLPDKKRAKEETREFLQEVQQYMFRMSGALCVEMDVPIEFFHKLYSLPKEPKQFYKRENYKDILETLYTNFHLIEGSYNIYLSYSDKKKTQTDEEYLNEHIKKLFDARMGYNECANRMIKLLNSK